ncbi:MAG: protease modulator HflC [Candidatus Omnitrophica bacterium]|nr:protease modulator HflC [Candidatus Omnitrophota bacterium]
MKQPFFAFLLIIISVVGAVVMNSAYVVDETRMAVVTQFGEPVSGPVSTPGLKWKIPGMQTVHFFDKRILEWDGYPSEVPTRDKKFIWVDVTGRWRIVDPLKFLKTMQTETKAQTRLDDIMDGVTRNFLTRHNLVDIVRSTNRILEIKELDVDGVAQGDYDKIEVGRDMITRDILNSARMIVKDYGIELIDLRIKRINYIASVQVKVFERMISERKRAAETLRSEGQGIRAEIEGEKDKELKRLTSEAYRKAQKIKGEADAESIRIYGDSFGKDPEFYSLIRTLEAYPAALKNSRLILSTDSEFLKYLKKAEQV